MPQPPIALAQLISNAENALQGHDIIAVIDEDEQSVSPGPADLGQYIVGNLAEVESSSSQESQVLHGWDAMPDISYLSFSSTELLQASTSAIAETLRCGRKAMVLTTSRSSCTRYGQHLRRSLSADFLVHDIQRDPVGSRTAGLGLADVIVGIPEDLHHTILPNHRGFRSYLASLGIIVLTDAEHYHGTFGAHSALVFRRLLNTLSSYQSSAAWFITMAPIVNPLSFVEELTSKMTDVIYGTGAPAGARRTYLVRPSLASDAPSRRGSTVIACAHILTNLVNTHRRVVCYARSREALEEIVLHAQRNLDTDMRDRVVGYRGGYLPTEKREIEERIIAGEIDGLVTTMSNESPFDLEQFDFAINQGVPETSIELVQLQRRLGEKGNASVTIIVTRPQALDQWIEDHPDSLSQPKLDWRTVPLNSSSILESHLLCGCHESSIDLSAPSPWTTPKSLARSMETAVQELVNRRLLHLREGSLFYLSRERPRLNFSLRGDTVPVRIVTQDGELIGTSDSKRAPGTLFEGARYLHGGRTYDISSFDQQERVAIALESSVNRKTKALSTTDAKIVTQEHLRRVGRCTVGQGRIVVTEHVIGYEERRPGKPNSHHEILLAPVSTQCDALWISIPPLALDERARSWGLHAIEHGAIGLLPLFSFCSSGDVGGISSHLPLLGSSLVPTGGTIVLYEESTDSVGVAHTLFNQITELLAAVSVLIHNCSCTDGCPRCIIISQCRRPETELSKFAAQTILGQLEIAL